MTNYITMRALIYSWPGPSRRTAHRVLLNLYMRAILQTLPFRHRLTFATPGLMSSSAPLSHPSQLICYCIQLVISQNVHLACYALVCSGIDDGELATQAEFSQAFDATAAAEKGLPVSFTGMHT